MKEIMNIDKSFQSNESSQAAAINVFLKNWGSTSLNEKDPLFRLVFSENEIELRTGEFDVTWQGVFLRTEKTTLMMPKYPDIKERYILEMWYPPEVSFCIELPNSKYGLYYPLYVFEDGKGNRLPLNQKVIELIMYSKFHSTPSQKDREVAIMNELFKKDEQYKAYVEDSVESSDIISNLHFGEGIIVPKNYDVECPNLKNKEN